MTSRIVPAVLTAPPVACSWTVPGFERWTVQAVCVTFSRGAVADPDRGYLLAMEASGFVLGQVGALDPATGVGSCTVTWADAPATAAAFGSDGYVVAPFPSQRLDPGYVLAAGIVHNHGGDAVVTAVAWVDYIPS